MYSFNNAAMCHTLITQLASRINIKKGIKHFTAHDIALLSNDLDNKSHETTKC